MKAWRGPIALFLVVVAILVGAAALPTAAHGATGIERAAEFCSQTVAADMFAHGVDTPARLAAAPVNARPRAILAALIAAKPKPRPKPRPRGVSVSRGDSRGGSWVMRALASCLAHEHPSAATCTACLSGRGHGAGGYCGPLQFGSAWGDYACVHGFVTWRACRTCSIAVFVHGANTGGRAYILRHWRATCGDLR